MFHICSCAAALTQLAEHYSSILHPCIKITCYGVTASKGTVLPLSLSLGQCFCLGYVTFFKGTCVAQEKALP